MLVDNLMTVAIVSAASALLNQLVVKLVLHPEKIKEKMEELKSFRTEQMAAARLKDQKLLKKLEKQQAHMSQVEKEVTSLQVKMMVVSMVTVLLPFYLLMNFLPMGDVAGYFSASLYGGEEKVSLSLFLWYTVCALFFSQVFRKAFGTGV